MTILIHFFEAIEHFVGVFGIFLLILGFARGALGWVRLELSRKSWEHRFIPLQNLRCVVGLHILFALELLIVADLINSFLAGLDYKIDENFFTSPAFYGLIQLAIIVAIRTSIDHFLSKELNSIREPSSPVS